MLSSLYNALTFQWLASNSQSDDKNKITVVDNENDEIKSLIFEKAEKFLENEKLNNVALNISDKAFEKFLNAIKKILEIYNKDINKNNILEFIERDTEFMYFGIHTIFAKYILENGWGSPISINKQINSHYKGDYFTNLISTSHHIGGKDSVVILSLAIKPNFVGKYHNVVKYFTDVPYNMKWNFVIDNKPNENYSLGLGIVSDKFEFPKSFLDASEE
jgi:hypothetical protein